MNNSALFNLDLPPGRTFPTHAYYREELGQGQMSLCNVLLAYSTFDSAVGYCQGIGFLAGLILSYFVSFLLGRSHSVLFRKLSSWPVSFCLISLVVFLACLILSYFVSCLLGRSHSVLFRKLASWPVSFYLIS